MNPVLAREMPARVESHHPRADLIKYGVQVLRDGDHVLVLVHRHNVLEHALAVNLSR